MANASERGFASCDVWVGSSLGVLKGVSLAKEEVLNFLPADTVLSKTDKSREITCMCWEHDSKEKLYAGLKNGFVQCFDCQQKYFSAECDLTGGQGEFVGLARHERVLITCTNEGSLALWPDGEEKHEIQVGQDVCKMKASPDISLLMATGGKDNDLKVWDGGRPDAPPVFKAKNLAHDFLDLKHPVWVSEIGFVPDTGSQPCIVVGTRHHELRLYDTRAQRRPVYSKGWKEGPVTAMEVLPDGRHFLVGNGHGDLARVDLRKGAVVNQYRGSGGGIRSISCCDDGQQSVFAVCGLDRYLRVFAAEPPTLLHKLYLKLQCSCLLFHGIGSVSQHHKERAADLTPASSLYGKHGREDAESEKESDDDLWCSLQVVSETSLSAGNRRKKTKRS